MDHRFLLVEEAPNRVLSCPQCKLLMHFVNVDMKMGVIYCLRCGNFPNRGQGWAPGWYRRKA